MFLDFVLFRFLNPNEEVDMTMSCSCDAGCGSPVADLAAKCNHNEKLLADLEDGRCFRISFKRPGRRTFTRMKVSAQDILRGVALREVVARQDKLDAVVDAALDQLS